MAIKIQARELVRYAKRNNLKINHNGTGDRNEYCARAILCHMFNGYDMYDFVPDGMTDKDINYLEDGFEGWRDNDQSFNKKNRYYKMGKNVARLAGLR